jgi:glycosyltransferase involved in cell wall biosynthesis
MNALDLHVLPSVGEAFPNVVAEAMACGTPCVVTDVGDAAYIVGDTGWVVPPKDSSRLAQAIQDAMLEIQTSGRETFGIKCRERIQNNFSLEKVADAYIGLWQRVLESKTTSLTSN